MSDFETQEFVKAFDRKPISIQEWGDKVNQSAAEVVRNYIIIFNDDMTSAELIGAYRKIIELGQATDAEECAFLDLIAS